MPSISPGSSQRVTRLRCTPQVSWPSGPAEAGVGASRARATRRSEEHTSELQSQSNLVCRLLLEKKNPDGDLRHADEWLHTPGYRLPQRRTGEERQMDPAAAVRQPGVRVRRLPAGDGSASPDHRLLRLLADRRAAPISIALGTPRAANRGGDGRGAGGASATALGGAGMERSGAWDLLQAARDRYGEEPREHDGAARAGHRLPAPPPSRQRRAAPALRRADRR